VATDPLANRQLDYELLDHAATEADVRAFCERLIVAGFLPMLVVTDGSKLYPPVIAAVWPEAEHQRWVFHFIKQLNEELREAFWSAYATMPAPPTRKRCRPKKRGRPREDGRKRDNREAVKAGAELLVFIAAWPIKRVQHWITLLQARAIENLAFVVGVNQCGTDPSFTYPGRSLVVDPHGVIIADAGDHEHVLRAEIDPAILHAWRTQFPALRDAGFAS
jgi:hypothetical protein